MISAWSFGVGEPFEGILYRREVGCFPHRCGQRTRKRANLESKNGATRYRIGRIRRGRTRDKDRL